MTTLKKFIRKSITPLPPPLATSFFKKRTSTSTYFHPHFNNLSDSSAPGEPNKIPPALKKEVDQNHDCTYQ